MKKILIALLALLLCLPALAECPITLDEPLSGVYVWPEGSTEADALYVYRYRYPQAAGDSEVALHLNTTYAYSLEDALGFEVPMLASCMQPGDPQKIVEIDYAVTHASEEYLSFAITKQVSVGGEATQVVSGHVFALTGPGAGRIVNLPVFLGLLDAEETDEWLLTRQTNKADRIIREMVWNMIQSGGSEAGYYDDLTYEELEASFYPEEDYCLTESGDLCFYFQPGSIAPEEMGLQTFEIPLWLVLDEF